MEETAEQVTSEHRAVLTLTDDGQFGGSVRGLELERPVWTVPVVVLDVDPKVWVPESGSWVLSWEFVEEAIAPR